MTFLNSSVAFYKWGENSEEISLKLTCLGSQTKNNHTFKQTLIISLFYLPSSVKQADK